jgi:flagellar motor switch/type III secretory pathway protein FliN
MLTMRSQSMLNDDFEIDEMEDFEENEEASEEIEEAAAQSSPIGSVSISDIRIKIQLEVGRFEVSLQELSKMEPGYKLPIEINPRIVNLTASGKVIGKGEMIEIGDTIGVKILELYK